MRQRIRLTARAPEIQGTKLCAPYLSRLNQASGKEPGDWMWEIKVLVRRALNASRSG